MKVLADWHHGNLYGSFHLLFEKRLGFELYRPIGREWFTEGFWKIAEPYGNAESTINQYLAINDKPYIPYENLNGGFKKIDNVYEIYDPENQFTHKAITLNTFKNMQFDLIIASHPLHECWEGLLQYQPKAKFIMQLGNDWQTTTKTNVLSSVWNYAPLEFQKVCYYHQEYPMQGLEWSEPQNNHTINNLVHTMPHPEIFQSYREKLSDFIFKSYGSGNPDGIPTTKEDMINIIKSSTFGWHIKPADGYGHLIHQWYACGRPIITKGSYYEGKTGGMLLTDGETCIDLDKHTVKENIELIRYWAEPENNINMCRKAMERFNAVCDFNTEAENIKTFLSNIL